jgi:predicted secreted acid phosphatase
MLNGLLHGTNIDRSHLAGAKRSLDSFSLILICEWLTESAELLEKKLGWEITDFDAFHLKENGGLKDYNLVKVVYGVNWRQSLGEENALDIELYDHAKVLAVAELKKYHVHLPKGAQG